VPVQKARGKVIEREQSSGRRSGMRSTEAGY
jgi:hypothetical protein